MPLFLTDAELAALRAIADRIFPATTDPPSPGAAEARVPEFIDAQLAGEWGRASRMYRQGPFEAAAHPGHGWQLELTPGDIYREGLALVEADVRARFGVASIAELDSADQDLVVEEMSLGRIAAPRGLTSADLFGLIRQNVIEGLFADPVHGGDPSMSGWAWIGFPGDPDAYGDPYSERVDHLDEEYARPPRGIKE